LKKATIFSLCVFLFFLVSFTGNMNSATFLVTSNLDTGAAGELRWAINSANASVGQDFINFGLPGPSFTITPTAPLPPLTDASGVIIDGLSQPGAAAGASPPSTASLIVFIDGIAAGPAHGLWIQSSNNNIRGLVISNFEYDGIRIEGTPGGTYSNVIYCNFIGTDPPGLGPLGNGRVTTSLWAGVDLIIDPQVGGVVQGTIVDSNLISANFAEGVAMINYAGGDVSYNNVTNNYIGTDINGMADLGNCHDGVYIGEGSHDNTVDNNLISGNDFDGVGIVGFWDGDTGFSTHSNTVSNNIIGLDVALAPLGNSIDGVSIGEYGTTPYGFAPDNTIITNTIAYNLRHGVVVWEHQVDSTNSDGNTISQNSIYDNDLPNLTGGLGIDLGDNGVTANDTNDPDPGANQELNFPVILTGSYCAGTTTITGFIDIDTTATLATVEIFWAIMDPSTHGEGARYVGSTVPYNATGQWTFTCFRQLSPLDMVTATTTDTNGNTSEFAHCYIISQSNCCDLDSSSVVDGADAVLLADYLAGNPAVIIGSADFNSDGSVDATDLDLLMNVLAGNL